MMDNEKLAEATIVAAVIGVITALAMAFVLTPNDLILGVIIGLVWMYVYKS